MNNIGREEMQQIKQSRTIVIFIVCIIITGLSVAGLFGAERQKGRKKIKQFSVKARDIVALKLIRSNDEGTASEVLALDLAGQSAVLERTGTGSMFIPRGIPIKKEFFEQCVKRALAGTYATRERAKNLLQGIVLIREDGREQYAEFPKKMRGPMKALYRDLMKIRNEILELGKTEQE